MYPVKVLREEIRNLDHS